MIINVNEFNYNIIKTLPVIRKKHPGKRGKHEKTYIGSINAFDIETSRITEIEQSIMYIWQMQIGPEYTVIGRTWYEFKYFMERISKIINDSTMVWYVHNLSYEFCFLKGIYNFDSSEVFRTDSRKVLKCSMYGNLEFRCSYLLTNLSLSRFTSQMGVENAKLSGEKFDYSKVRYPDTVLTDFEINYCINDVKGLVQALTKLFELDGDNVRTVPLTATGYVRRDVKRAMRNYNYEQLHDMLPDIHIQTILFERFRGGDTHRNRWLANVILKNVKSMDRVSSYPDVMLNCPVPMSKFYPLPESSLETVKFMLNGNRYALLMRIAFWDIELKDMFNGAVYLSRDKCRNIMNGEWDNGRIIKRAYLECSLTDVDMRLILKYYKFSRSNPFEVYYRKYKKLPKMLTDVVMKYYKVKTELKGISEDDPQYIYYCNRKRRLNARYGMLVQSPCKQTIDYTNGTFVERNEPPEKLLEQSNKKAFLNYRWGVWVTRWARYRLHEVIQIAGHNAVYWDTDSVKYLGSLDVSAYNAERIRDSTESGAYATDRNGKIHYMGVFEDEGYKTPNRFKTMGAKKYVLEDANGKLHITIAGVNKRKGGEELGKLSNFKEGFTFIKAGGTESVYNDNVHFTFAKDGHILEITDNVVIKESTYTLGLTADYLRILERVWKLSYFENEVYGLYHKDIKEEY